MSPDSKGRREVGTTEPGASPLAVPIRDVACGGERGGGGEDAARGNEDNHEVSEVSLEKLEFRRIST